MSLKKVVAQGMFLEKKKEETIEFLADNIANSFALLANIEPSVALGVLEQMNEQFNEEDATELAESINEQIEKVAEAVNITEDDLED